MDPFTRTEQTMSTCNPVDLLFDGMAKLGPGSDADTRHVLSLLPRRDFQVIVDAGCGAGRQTLVLARELMKPVHAVDSHQPFLVSLNRRAQETGLGHLVRTHCMDMKDIPQTFGPIDLLWAEGAAYNIGFAHALSVWATAIRPGGFAVVSELVWLRDDAPSSVRDFFQAGYPDMQPFTRALAVAKESGYKVLTTHQLPSHAWVDGYYEILEPRAEALASHADSSVREFATETLREIGAFRASEGSFGYVFLVLQRS